MSRILIGTSSWTEPTLVKAGTFYPKKTMTAEERLKFYASQFPVAEVDSTYYAPPTVRNAELWIERTPKDFVFDIKAFALLTGHPARIDRLPKDLAEELPKELARQEERLPRQGPARWVDEVWERFREALFPLHSAGKLGVVLFQFPQWFLPGPRLQGLPGRVRRAAARLPHRRRVPAPVWLSEKNAERTLGVPGGARPAARVRGHAAGVRLEHARARGRHREGPGGRAVPRARPRRLVRHGRHGGRPVQVRLLEGASSRSGRRASRSLAAQARETHVIMNNCYRDFAVKSARQMARCSTWTSRSGPAPRAGPRGREGRPGRTPDRRNRIPRLRETLPTLTVAPRTLVRFRRPGSGG